MALAAYRLVGQSVSPTSPTTVKESMVERFKAYVEANKDRFIEELSEFCRQPSISAQNVGMLEMADMVKARLDKLGGQARLLETGGPPAVYAEMGKGEQTLLFYNHYDVQPPDPLDLWETPPFEPTIRDGKIYARGVSDDKGDLMARMQAVEAYQAVFGELPLRLKWLAEGEEETGSPHLAALADKHADLLKADGCLWETGGKDEGERLRGTSIWNCAAKAPRATSTPQ
jgi:acetylornithine deacetylase/succinyl-diaminopimelate desuccinylase-like protein